MCGTTISCNTFARCGEMFHEFYEQSAQACESSVHVSNLAFNPLNLCLLSRELLQIHKPIVVKIGIPILIVQHGDI